MNFDTLSMQRSAINTPMIDERSDFEIVLARAKQHDMEAMSALYKRALPPIYRYVLIRIHRAELIEDIVSEIFLAMVESIAALRSATESGFYSWLFHIAQSKVVDALRRLAKQDNRLIALTMDDVEGDRDRSLIERALVNPRDDPATIHEQHEQLAELGQAINTLTEEQQFVITGRFLVGLTTDEIAGTLQKQPGAIRVMQHRALTILAERLGSFHRRKGRTSDES